MRKIVILLICVIVFAVFSTYYYFFATDTYELHGIIKNKYNETYGELTFYYLNLTDGRILEVDTNIFRTEVNPQAVYGQIETNKNYTFECWGYNYGAWRPKVLTFSQTP